MFWLYQTKSQSHTYNVVAPTILPKQTTNKNQIKIMIHSRSSNDLWIFSSSIGTWCKDKSNENRRFIGPKESTTILIFLLKISVSWFDDKDDAW